MTKEVMQQAEPDLIPQDKLFVCGQMGANITRVTAQPEHEMRHWAEEYECVVKCLDDAGVPKADGEGVGYSLWGRINRYANPPLPVQPEAKVPDAKDAANEAAAKALYETWHILPGYVPWQDGGNSLIQEEARELVRLAAHNIKENT